MNTYIFDRLKKALRLGAIAFLLPLSSSLFTACEDVPMPFNNPELPPEPDIVVIEPSGDGTKENPYNVAGVLAYINTLGADVESTRDIYVTGVVTAVTESFSVQYGNASFVISDTDEGANKFTFYRGLYLGNTKYNNENDTNVKEDDVVVICGKIVNYRGSTPETVQNKAYLVSLNGKTVEPAPEPTEADAKGSGTQADPYNVAGALKYITSLGADVNSPNDIFIKGKVKEVKEQFGTQYGNSTFTMVDEGFDAIFTAYRILYLGNAKYTEGDVLKEGDEVIVCGKVVNYRGNTPETVQGSAYLYSLNGKTGSGGGGGETPVGDAKGSGTQADPYNAAGANAYIASLAADTESDKEIYVKGKIIEITDKNQFNTNYGNCTFYISDDGQDGDNKFYVFRTYYLGNVKYSDDSWTLPKAGDEVIICGKVINYKGNTPETVANKSYIYSLNGKTEASGGGGGDTAEAGTTAEKPFTPAEANAFIATLAADTNTETDYYIKGKIIEITDKNQFSTQYGNCSFYISDDGTDKADKFYVFRTYYLGNVKYSDDSWTLPKAGDEVIICGKLVNYKGNTPETVANKSYIYSLNGSTK